MSKESSECKCVCHVSSNGCCEKCDNPLVKHLVNVFNGELKALREFYTSYGDRLAVIEDLFAGKSFKPIHDAMELHVERFDGRLNVLEAMKDDYYKLIRAHGDTLVKFEKLKSEDYSAQLEGLEEKIADELEILKGFNDETQKGYNRLSERIESVEKGLENYREYRTDIEDLCTDVMYIKERLDKLKGYMQMEDRVTASDVLCRLTKLESDHLDQLNPHAFVILKKEIDEMKANVFFNKDNRHDLNCALRGIQHDYQREIRELERVFSGVDLEIQKDINENVKPKVNELWEMTGNGLRDLQSRISCLELEMKAGAFKSGMDDASKFIECIAGLESKLTARIDDVLKTCIKEDLKLEDQIIKIESHIYSAGDISAIHGQLDNIQKNDLHNDHRIEMLEKTILELVDKIAEIGNHYYREKQTPHKCPVCNADPEYITQGTYKCVSCEGKGVLWK